MSQPSFIGVDIAKRTLDCAHYDQDTAVVMPNTAAQIRAWLKRVPAASYIAIESTGTYHLELAEQAHHAGHQVYLIDGYRLSRYRDSVGIRAKTDHTDAQLLARYLAHEHQHLHRHTPQSQNQRRLWTLLQRRAKVVELNKTLQQSMADMPELKRLVATIQRRIALLIERIEQQMGKLCQALQWTSECRRLQAMHGIGELTSTALVAGFHRAPFRNADAFVAFLGLDVRVRESGGYKGRRKLTKKGNAECRRLLFNAARVAVRADALRPYYERLINRGLSHTQAIVAVMRKMVRIAYALLRDKSEYRQPAPAMT